VIAGTLDFEAAGACEEHEGWDVEKDDSEDDKNDELDDEDKDKDKNELGAEDGKGGFVDVEGEEGYALL
jgi:hypothetical protein